MENSNSENININNNQERSFTTVALKNIKFLIVSEFKKLPRQKFPTAVMKGYGEKGIRDELLNFLNRRTGVPKAQLEIALDELIPETIYYNSREEEFVLKKADLSEMEREIKIAEILSKELPAYQSLGIGIHNNVFYFGTKLNDEEGRVFDAVVTSDKKIYVDWGEKNEIKEEFGLNYRFPFFNEVIDHMWSRTGKYGINAWLYGDLKEISLKEVYERVLELVKSKWWSPDERNQKYVTLDIISTYFLPVFEAKGRTLTYGDPGFGKTRLMRVFQLLAFNPSMSMDFSDPSIFRIIESTKATILIDNYDTLEEEKKKRILHILLTGYTSGQKAVRIEGKTRFVPRGFDVFSHMVINSILPLNEVAEDRSNIIRSLRTDDPKYAKLDPKNPVWQETMDMLHVCALQNWKKVKQTYDELKEKELVARELERSEAVLTIAKAIDLKLYEEMLKYFKEEVERRKVRDVKEEWLYAALSYIIEKLGDKSEIEISVKEIGEVTAAEIFDSNAKDFSRQVHNYKIYLGKAFRANPLFKSKIKEGYSFYTFTKDALLKFCKMKNYDELVKKLQSKLKDYLP